MSRRAALIGLLDRQIERLEFQIARHEEDGLSDAAAFVGLQASLDKAHRDRDALRALTDG